MNKVPAVRFEGFDENFEIKQISDLFKITRGYVLPTSDVLDSPFDKNQYPVYSSQTMNNGLLGYYHKHLYENAITWTTDGANAGTVSFRDGKFYCTNVCGVLLKGTVEPNKMIAEALNRVAKRHVSYCGNPKLMNNVMSEIEILLPNSLPEQQTIGSFFATLDNTISDSEQRYIKLKQLKVAYLDKLFPREGKKEPQMRLKGFSGRWEEKQLGEIVDIVSGGTPDTKNPIYWGGDINWFTGTELNKGVYALESDKKLTELGYQNCSAKWLEPHKTVLFASCASIGESAILKKRAVTNQNIEALVVKEGLDVYFLYSATHKIKKFALENAYGSTFVIIIKSKLAKCPLLIPSLEEQIAIGNFFKELDNLITLQKKKCEKLKQIKQFYLDKMFV